MTKHLEKTLPGHYDPEVFQINRLYRRLLQAWSAFPDWQDAVCGERNELEPLYAARRCDESRASRVVRQNVEHLL